MRALIISDIHSNLQALEAVLAAAPQYDAVWNLGDVVGYGANPNEVVDLARKLGGICVRGNHDRAAVGLWKPGEYLDFSGNARFAAGWTQKALSNENTKWLSRLPRGPVRPLGRKVACVHGSPADDDEYIVGHPNASAALRANRDRIIFCGHAHYQGAWISKRGKLALLIPKFRPHSDSEQFELPLSDKCRYILNPGSVGQPRDRDWRAAFAIYDDTQSLFTWHRASYKVRAAQMQIRRANLPEYLADRLREGRSSLATKS